MLNCIFFSAVQAFFQTVNAAAWLSMGYFGAGIIHYGNISLTEFHYRELQR
jgi:hypothetical protein